MAEPADHEFVCEPLTPARGTGDPRAMARGEPGVPDRFTWRDREYRLVGVVESWKTSGPCRHGSGEVYLRRHWYRIVADPPAELVVYFDRQARKPGKPRWWVHTARRSNAGLDPA
jgi:phosphoribosylglycinamide formyltransferase-1